MKKESYERLLEEVRRKWVPELIEEQRRRKTIDSAERYLRRREIEKERNKKLKAERDKLKEERDWYLKRIRIFIPWKNKLIKSLFTEELEPWQFQLRTEMAEHLEAEIKEFKEKFNALSKELGLSKRLN